MIRLTLLTDGEYPACEGCEGRIVEGTEFKSLQGELRGYDVTVKELRRVGATLNDMDWADDDTLYFSINSNPLCMSEPEIEVTQDEYR